MKLSKIQRYAISHWLTRSLLPLETPLGKMPHEEENVQDEIFKIDIYQNLANVEFNSTTELYLEWRDQTLLGDEKLLNAIKDILQEYQIPMSRCPNSGTFKISNTDELNEKTEDTSKQTQTRIKSIPTLEQATSSHLPADRKGYDTTKLVQQVLERSTSAQPIAHATTSHAQLRSYKMSMEKLQKIIKEVFEKKQYHKDKPNHHLVQFYEDKQFICEALAQFIKPALTSDGAAIVIAIQSHLNALERQLTKDHIDVEYFKQQGQLVLLEASETLSKFMIEGKPNPEAFDHVIQRLVERMSHKYSNLRAYGEMVNVLCEAGNKTGALELENLWNILIQKYPLTLLCSYSLDSFKHDPHNDLHEICSAHTTVIPAESFLELANQDAQERMITELQQKSIALATEITQRENIIRQRTQELQKAYDNLKLEMEERLDIQKKLGAQTAQLKVVEDYRHQQEEFINTVCHEIRNPLNVIYGTVILLKDKITEIEDLFKNQSDRMDPLVATQFHEALVKLREDLVALEESSKLQKTIVDDVLYFSKLENDKVELNPTDFCLQQKLETITKMFAPELQKRKLEIELQLPDNLIWLKADEVRLQQVLINLLSNAIKFSREEDKITLTAHFEIGSLPEAKLTIEIKDTGIGMTPEELSKLFERFKQANARISTEYGGSGLGLIICKKLIEKMGGDIAVTSQKYQGTTFKFFIKCLSPTDREVLTSQRKLVHLAITSRKRSEEVTKSPTSQCLNPHILIVEDVLMNQKILARFLEDKGYHVKLANNGLEAVNYCKKLNFDLIFMDIEMPIMGGLEATRQIRVLEKTPKSKKRTYIIGCSGNARGEQIAEAIQSGMDHYLTKPYHRDEIYQLIDKCLAHPSFITIEKKPQATENENKRKSESSSTDDEKNTSPPLIKRPFMLFGTDIHANSSHKTFKPSVKSLELDSILWQSALDQSSELIFVVDTDLRYIILNRAAEEEAEKVFGKKIKIGMSIIEATANQPLTQQRVIAIWKKALLGHSSIIEQEFAYHDGATPQRYQISYMPIKNQEHKTVGAACHIRNLTALQHLLDTKSAVAETQMSREHVYTMKP